MPKMDGLQVLTIVRRKFPNLRTVVLTGLHDEQFRSRAYAMGVDMYWQKPGKPEETRLFLECMEALLSRQAQEGFRGVQSKSLVDIVQLECLSQSSSVLRITHKGTVGRIWINHGELIDAEVEDMCGEAAFHRILAWKTGGFETLPPEPSRQRTIDKACNGLLLEVAQAADEQAAGDTTIFHKSPFGRLENQEGLEVAVLTRRDANHPVASRGLEDPIALSRWTRETLKTFETLGETLGQGRVLLIDGQGSERHIGLGCCMDNELCVGWAQHFSALEVRDKTEKILTTWGS
jgi:CheY-like chemotaxis protein